MHASSDAVLRQTQRLHRRPARASVDSYEWSAGSGACSTEIDKKSPIRPQVKHKIGERRGKGREKEVEQGWNMAVRERPPDREREKLRQSTAVGPQWTHREMNHK